jgi:hypothetical protein
MFIINPPAILEPLAPLVQKKVAVQPGVLGFAHHTHAARTNLREDFVGAETCAGLHRHKVPANRKSPKVYSGDVVLTKNQRRFRSQIQCIQKNGTIPPLFLIQYLPGVYQSLL